MMRVGSSGEFEALVPFGAGFGTKKTDYWLDQIAERPVLGAVPGSPAVGIGRDLDVRLKSEGAWLAGQLEAAAAYRDLIGASVGRLAKAGLAAVRPVLHRRPTPAEAPVVAWALQLGQQAAQAPPAYVANKAILDLAGLYIGQGLKIPDCIGECDTPPAALKSAPDRNAMAAMADLAARNEAARKRTASHAPYCPRQLGSGYVCDCRYDPAYAFRH